MKALILAAGRGRRMSYFTETTHKSLVPLLGKPLLEWQLEALKFSGIKSIVALTGYQRDKIAPYFSTYYYNERWASTNMAYSLLQADLLLSDEEVLICYSDIAYHPQIIEKLIQSKQSISITYDQSWKLLWQARFADPLEDAESFKCKNSSLIEIGQKASYINEIEGQYMGLIKLHPSGWKEVKKLITLQSSLTEVLKRLLEKNVKIQAVPINGKWLEIDTIADLHLYENKLSSPTRWSHDFRWV